MTGTSCKLFQAHATTDARRHHARHRQVGSRSCSAIFGPAGTLRVLQEFQNGTPKNVRSIANFQTVATPSQGTGRWDIRSLYPCSSFSRTVLLLFLALEVGPGAIQGTAQHVPCVVHRTAEFGRAKLNVVLVTDPEAEGAYARDIDIERLGYRKIRSGQ